MSNFRSLARDYQMAGENRRRAVVMRCALPVVVTAAVTIASPANAQRSLDGLRGLGPLGGLVSVAPEEVADAAISCAQVVNGAKIDSDRLKAIGWHKVAAADVFDPGQSADFFDFYLRPNGRVQLKIGKTGDAAASCSASAVIGNVANEKRIKALISDKLGEARENAPNLLRLNGATSWSTPTASVLLQTIQLQRGGASSSHVAVLPVSGKPEGF